MPQVPTAARRRRRRDDDEDSSDFSPTPHKQLQLSARLLDQVQVPRLGRPPRTDDEKREVYLSLAYLKSAGKTHKECAEALDVSERTIANYLDDSVYQDICQELQGQAVSQGHTTISMLIDDALGVIFEMMHGSGSDFVRFKAAETLLNFAGYNLPREVKTADNREDLSRFFRQVAEREEQQRARVQVNIQVTQSPGPALATTGATIVDASSESLSPPPPASSGDPWSSYLPQVQEDQAFYGRTVLPGGRLPPEYGEPDPAPTTQH